MGWDTEIIIIAEEIKSETIAKQIASRIFVDDSIHYSEESCFFIKEKPEFSLYYSYTRRKYAPYWIIEKISAEFKEVKFTLIGSMLEFVCGPAGLIRINDGKISDSYGIIPDDKNRRRFLESPSTNKEHIYEWFKHHGYERALRNELVDKFPLKDCEENYIDKLIQIDDDKFNNLEIRKDLL